MKAINRQLQPLILDALKSFPVVYINGPRQAGKTTLVKELLAKEFKAGFITFDDTLERAAAMRNPRGYVEASGTPLIIDEVQMVRELFRPLNCFFMTPCCCAICLVPLQNGSPRVSRISLAMY